MPSLIINTLLTESLQELNAIGSGDTPPQWMSAQALSKLQQLVDQWNAIREAVYFDDFLPFTLPTTGNPTTIGPTGDWVVTERPVDIDGISIVVAGGSTPSYVPLRKRDRIWWQSQP